MSDTFEQNTNTLTIYIVKVWAKVYNQYFKKGYPTNNLVNSCPRLKLINVFIRFHGSPFRSCGYYR